MTFLPTSLVSPLLHLMTKSSLKILALNRHKICHSPFSDPIFLVNKQELFYEVGMLSIWASQS